MAHTSAEAYGSRKNSPLDGHTTVIEIFLTSLIQNPFFLNLFIFFIRDVSSKDNVFQKLKTIIPKPEIPSKDTTKILK